MTLITKNSQHFLRINVTHDLKKEFWRKKQNLVLLPYKMYYCMHFAHANNFIASYEYFIDREMAHTYNVIHFMDQSKDCNKYFGTVSVSKIK